MYCKHCGKEISEDSKFCKECGEKIVEQSSKPKQNDNESSGCLIAFISFTIIIIIIALSLIIIGNIDKIENFIHNNTTQTTYLRKAERNDINLEFYTDSQYASSEKYYFVLQANEKIKGLVLKISFLDKDGNTLKEQTVNVGDVTPGNEYKHWLDQSEIAFDDLDKTKSFRIKVIEGNVVN